MHIKYQVQQIKGIQIRLQLLLKLKSDEKLISKIIFVAYGL